LNGAPRNYAKALALNLQDRDAAKALEAIRELNKTE
jgi:hypothetical protein